jgi:hypothetical protein
VSCSGVKTALLQNYQQEHIVSNPVQQNNRTEIECSRLITYPVLLASVLSPFALVMNLAFPYWDFLFTPIYSLSLGRWVAEGITATFITITMLAFAVIFSELMHRRTFCGRQANSAPSTLLKPRICKIL